MKKRLLFGALLTGSFLTANAQEDCDNALALTVGTITVDEITGAYEDNCFAPADANAANWYMYTPAQNGILRINTNLPVNDGEAYSDDTRISIYTGTCDDLTCWTGSDDVSTTNYLTDLSFQVLADETYYIAFDNNWNPMGFQAEVTFTAVACFGVSGGFGYSAEPGVNTASISWTAALGDPEGYSVLWGPTGFDPETAGTLIENLETPEVTIEGLTANSNYDFYVITDCGDSESDLVGPIGFTTLDNPDTIPYENGFEELVADGMFFFGTVNIVTNEDVGGEYALDGEAFAFTSAGAESWIFKGFELEAGETVAASFSAAYLGDADDSNTVELTVGPAAWAEGQEVVESFDVFGGGDALVYEEYEATFTADEAGVYYFGIHNLGDSEGGFSLLFDNVMFEEGTAGVNDVLASKFTVYPNPANNVINIANAENILVNGVVITDLNGRTVKNVSYNGVTEAQINVSDLAAGMYMMTVSSDKGTMTKKIVKN